MAVDKPPLLLTTPRLHLALLSPEAAERVLAYYEANKDHLGPVSPERPATYFTLAFWRTRLAQDEEDWRSEVGVKLFLLPREQPLAQAPVVGSVSLTNIRRGPLQSAELGFGLDRRYVGRGLMTEALEVVCEYAFNTLGLHRLEACHLPENRRSAAVLARAGFTVEGYARELVLIEGRWRDHVVTARVAPAQPERS
jgi:[ribosomal protein S5]-alanine N-acetyltransferase